MPRLGCDQGIVTTGDERQTFGQYLTRWLDMMRPNLKARTLQRYTEHLQLHVTPTLGSVKLKLLSAQHLQQLYAAQLAEGLSPTTVHHCHCTIHHALYDALRLGLVSRNVAELVTPPRPTHTEMHVLTPEQAQRLLRAVAEDRLVAFYMLALFTGMRLGEMLALHWADVDLDTGTLQVRYTLHHPHGRGGEYILTEPKTAKSRRRLELPPTVVQALHQHHARQLAERLRAGPAWHEQDFVFTREDGEPLRGTHVLQRQFYPLLDHAGLPHIRLHDLRHTAATLLLLQNVPAKVVSELLGHATVAITLDRYSHVLPSMQRDAASAMERLLSAR